MLEMLAKIVEQVWIHPHLVRGGGGSSGLVRSTEPLNVLEFENKNSRP